jgi:ech hydrogenase subunit D
MTEPQPLAVVTTDTLLAKVLMFQHEGYRLVHISAATLKDSLEITYGFDRNLQYQALRVNLPPGPARIPSISRIYWAAFLYENEIHDLYNVEVDGMAVDFKGKLVKTAIPFPFAPKTGGVSIATVAPAPAPAAAPAPTPVAPAQT